MPPWYSPAWQVSTKSWSHSGDSRRQVSVQDDHRNGDWWRPCNRPSWQGIPGGCGTKHLSSRRPEAVCNQRSTSQMMTPQATVRTVKVDGIAYLSFSWADQPEKNVIQCEHCGEPYDKASWLGYLWTDKKRSWVTQHDRDVTKAMSIVGHKGRRDILPHGNSGYEYRMTCVLCCQRLHNVKYMNKKGTPNGRFRNASELSRGRFTEQKRQRVASTMGCMNNLSLSTFNDVQASVKKDRIAMDTDWVSEISPEAFIAYG